IGICRPLPQRWGRRQGMKLKAPPYGDVIISFDGEESPKLEKREKAALIAMWPKWWPQYREVLRELFSGYEYEDPLRNQGRLRVQKLIPNKKNNWGGNLLLSFSFDETGITWDIFQRDRTIVHA